MPGSHVADEFARLLVEVAERYPGFRLREGTIRAYAYDLGDLSLEQVRRAMLLAVRESEFFPSVATVRRFVAGTADDAGLVAWAAFRQAAEDVGAYMALDVEDGAAARALVTVFGSWPAFCAVDNGPELGQRRSEFLAAYRQERRRGGPNRRLEGLVGGAHPNAGALRGRWVGRIAAGGVVLATPDRAAIGSGTRGQDRLLAAAPGEAGAAQASDTTATPGGAEGHQLGPRGDGGA